MRSFLFGTCLSAAAVFAAGSDLCERGTDQAVAGRQAMGHAGRKLCQHASFDAQADHGRQCRQAAGGVDVLDGRIARSRGRAPGDRRHDVPSWAVPESGLRIEPRRREQDRLEIPAGAGSDRHSGHVLRYRQPRPVLCRRQDLPEPGRYDAGGARRQDRQGRLVAEERRSEQGRDLHRRAARDQGQGPGRHLRRRVRRSRFGDGLRHEDRQAGVARLLDGPRQRHADRPGQDHVSRQAGRCQFQPQHVARRPVEDRRRHHVGLVFLRSPAEPGVLRLRQSLDLEPEAAARRQQVVDDDLGARRRHRRGAMGLSDDAPRRVGL